MKENVKFSKPLFRLSLIHISPILIEIQALVTRTNFGLPRRTSVGIDYNRVNLLMAVLEKRAGLHLGDCDAYVNLAGDVYKRQLKDGVCAVVEKDSYPIPPIFTLMAKEGNIEEQMMYNTYNMGIGMIVAVDPEDVDKTMEAMKAAGDTPYVIGKIENGEKGVKLV